MQERLYGVGPTENQPGVRKGLYGLSETPDLGGLTRKQYEKMVSLILLGSLLASEAAALTSCGGDDPNKVDTKNDAAIQAENARHKQEKKKKKDGTMNLYQNGLASYMQQFIKNFQSNA